MYVCITYFIFVCWHIYTHIHTYKHTQSLQILGSEISKESTEGQG